MRNRFLRQTAFLLSLVIIIGLCVVDAGAQSRRRRRPRRVTKKVVKPVVTNPAIAAPGEEQTASDGERIISTADGTETEQTAEPGTPKKSTTKAGSSSEMQKTINQLSNQVDRLSDKLTQMQQGDRTLIDMERLTRAEVRAESLRAQQVEVEGKLADAQSKLELIEYQLRPENIEHASGYGTVHPEEAREARRRQLENEKARMQAQVKILETSRTRLETALVTADAEVDSLRRKIEQQQAQQDTSGVTVPESRPAPPPE
jgi:chromosome segregation ATPase